MLFKFTFLLLFLFAAVAAKKHRMAKNNCGQNPNFLKLVNRSAPIPRPAPGKPLSMNISAVIQTVSIDQDNKELEATFLFRQEWRDPRLAFESEDKEEYRIIENRESIWTPDLFFPNSVVIETGDDTKNISIKHFPDGRVLFSQRKIVKTSCSENTRPYPFDMLTCQLKIESYGHTVDDITAKWNNSQNTAVVKRFLYHDFITTVTSEPGINLFRGTAFSSPTMVFSVGRTPSAIIFRVLLPMVFITMCSWASFLLSIGENMMRVSLYLTPIVTYILQMNFCVAFFISPEYLTGLDVWCGTSLTAMFISTVESAYILFKKDSGNRIVAGVLQKPNLRERIALALFVSLLDILSILSVFLSRFF